MSYGTTQSGVHADDLERAMNALTPGDTPLFHYDRLPLEEVTEETVRSLSKDGNWIAGTGDHAVVVEGVTTEGNVRILDPLDERSYEVRIDQFNEEWTRSGIFRN